MIPLSSRQIQYVARFCQRKSSLLILRKGGWGYLVVLVTTSQLGSRPQLRRPIMEDCDKRVLMALKSRSKSLCLDSNKLHKLSDSLGRLVFLTSLSVKNNHLKSLNCQLAKLTAVSKKTTKYILFLNT